jgi:hypothetical protein
VDGASDSRVYTIIDLGADTPARAGHFDALSAGKAWLRASAQAIHHRIERNTLCESAHAGSIWRNRTLSVIDLA